jgi:hypothetical protein
MPWRVEERAPSGACTVTRNAVAVTIQAVEYIDVYSDSEQALDYIEMEPVG